MPTGGSAYSLGGRSCRLRVRADSLADKFEECSSGALALLPELESGELVNAHRGLRRPLEYHLVLCCLPRCWTNQLFVRMPGSGDRDD